MDFPAMLQIVNGGHPAWAVCAFERCPSPLETGSSLTFNGFNGFNHSFSEAIFFQRHNAFDRGSTR